MQVTDEMRISARRAFLAAMHDKENHTAPAPSMVGWNLDRLIDAAVDAALSAAQEPAEGGEG